MFLDTLSQDKTASLLALEPVKLAADHHQRIAPLVSQVLSSIKAILLVFPATSMDTAIQMESIVFNATRAAVLAADHHRLTAPLVSQALISTQPILLVYPATPMDSIFQEIIVLFAILLAKAVQDQQLLTA